MEPMFRPAAPEGAPPSPCPPGCVAEPAGVWKGEPAEVVYDPRRFGIAFVIGGPPAALEDTLRGAGWMRVDADHNKYLWVLDRVAATRSRLAALEHRDAPGRSLA